MIKFHIITIFPETIRPYTEGSLLGRAQKDNRIKIYLYDLRDYTEDKHRSVDDKPYGGGPGMVLMIEPIFKAVGNIKKKIENRARTRTILFSTRGSKFDKEKAKSFSEYDEMIMICGRYEGVDERVAQYIADEEISIGDYILSGGELPALIVTEAVSRFISGVLGKEESLEEIKGSYPVYTRPESFKVENQEWKVPDILLSGNHKEIEKWRKSSK